MTHLLANARIGRHAIAVVVLAAAACSADPVSSVSPNFVIDRPTGYPQGAFANCDGKLSDELARVCWTRQGAGGPTIFDPLTQAMVCTCPNATNK